MENLRKLGITFHLENAEKTYEDVFENFKEKIRLDQKRKEKLEIEKRRNEIFRKFLLNRVHGTVLKDFYSRI
jgi:ABC-type transport system involved in cytochrome bd biosynthesis fused ATPase/permease subunit